MINLEETIIKNLKEGKANYGIFLNEWFSEGKYSYIWALIEGCDKIINYNLLYFTILGIRQIIIFDYNKSKLKTDQLICFLEKSGYLLPLDNLSREELLSIWENRQQSICKKLLEGISKIIKRHPEYEKLLEELSLIDFEKISSSHPITDSEIEKITLNHNDYDILWDMDYDVYKRIIEGNFDINDIDNWFDNFDYTPLSFVVRECQLNNNTEYLNHILKKCQKIVEFLDGENTRKCNRMIFRILRHWHNNSENHSDVIERLSTSKNDQIRLYCCANYDYSKFLEDPDSRISRVAKIREEFEYKWNNIDDDERARIKLISEALKVHAISLYDGLIGYKEPYKCYAEFNSFLFTSPKSCSGFDRDKFTTIQNDRRVLAYEINEMIKKGEISFKQYLEPSCFKKITINEFFRLSPRIDSDTKEELIEKHKKLIGKSCKRPHENIEDCGIAFIKKILFRDNDMIVRNYLKTHETEQSFLKSKYLSDYFKQKIKELLPKEKLSDIAIDALKSDKHISEMTEEELKDIFSSMNIFYNEIGNNPIDIREIFLLYINELNGKGVISFVNNNINPDVLARLILRSSGLSPDANFYNGRGVNRFELNANNLTLIFNNLLKYDVSYAIKFVIMVKSMETLGATEFINTFITFASNDFELFEIENRNTSLNSLSLDKIDALLFAIIHGPHNTESSDIQIQKIELMKDEFLSNINEELKKLNSEDSYTSDGQNRPKRTIKRKV